MKNLLIVLLAAGLGVSLYFNYKKTATVSVNADKAKPETKRDSMRLVLTIPKEKLVLLNKPLMNMQHPMSQKDSVNYGLTDQQITLAFNRDCDPCTVINVGETPIRALPAEIKIVDLIQILSKARLVSVGQNMR